LANKTLTSAAVERLKPPHTGQVDHFDQGYPGLALRMSYGGRKTFVYFYRLGGRLRRMSLGTYPAIGLAEAREAWRKARADVQAGRDPVDHGGERDGATDFQGVFEEWLKRDQAGNRSVNVVRRSIERDVLPHWRNRQITDIGRRDVLDVIDAIADRGAPIMARRTHARLHRLFKWAVGRGIIPTNPLADLPKPGEEIRRDRVLSDDELVAVWKAAEQIGWPYGAAVRLLILTGARREEIGQLRWSEIDGDTNFELHSTTAQRYMAMARYRNQHGVLDFTTISLDAHRTKNGEPHHLPLSSPALTLLDQAPRIAGCDFVFTSSGKTHIAAWALAKAKLDQVSQVTAWRIHDLRRTAATGLQKLGTPLQVTEAILGHTAGSRAGVVGIYQRYDYANEKRAALEAWGAHVMALVEGRTANVVAINAGQS
jgi:integrase